MREIVTVEGPRAKSATLPVLELHDAIGKLSNLGLLIEDANGAYSVKDIDDSLHILDTHWSELTSITLIEAIDHNSEEHEEYVAPVDDKGKQEEQPQSATDKKEK